MVNFAASPNPIMEAESETLRCLFIIALAIKIYISLTNRTQYQDEGHKIRLSTRLMMQGKVQAAMKWITDRSKNKVLLKQTWLKQKTAKVKNHKNQYCKF